MLQSNSCSGQKTERILYSTALFLVLSVIDSSEFDCPRHHCSVLTSQDALKCFYCQIRLQAVSCLQTLNLTVSNNSLELRQGRPGEHFKVQMKLPVKMHVYSCCINNRVSMFYSLCTEKIQQKIFVTKMHVTQPGFRSSHHYQCYLRYQINFILSTRAKCYLKSSIFSKPYLCLASRKLANHFSPEQPTA